jgi:hypothetical protein
MDRSDRGLDRRDPDEARGTDVQTEELAERQDEREGTAGQYGVNLDGDAREHDKPDAFAGDLKDRSEDQPGVEADRSDVDRSDMDRSDMDRSDMDRSDMDRSDVEPMAKQDADPVGRRDTESDGEPDLGREPDRDSRDSLDQQGKESPGEPPGPVSIGDESATAEATPTGVVATPGSAPAAAPETSAAEASVTAMQIGEAEAGVTGDDGERVLAEDKVREFTARWEGVQLAFLDSPSQAVRDADRLVTELLDHVTARLDERRSALEDRWNGDTETNTENLRVTLQQYRGFFRRLIAS